MRKLLRYRIFGLALIMAIGIMACDTASQEVEPVISPDGYPVATFSPISTTCIEGDTVYFQITTDKPIDRSITFTFVQTGGTTTTDDYTAFPAVLEPYTKSVDLMIITWRDLDADVSETLLGEIGVNSIPDRYLLNPETVNPTAVSLTISNYVGIMTVDFYWDKDITIGEYTYSTIDYVDFDILIADVEGFDLNDFMPTAIWAAASNNHPESFSFESLADGSYYFIANLFSNALAGEGANTTIPITSVFNRQGTSLIDYELTQSEEDAMSSEQPGFDEDGSEFNMILFKITIAEGKYTIYDTNDLNLGTYKKSSTGKSGRPFLNK